MPHVSRPYWGGGGGGVDIINKKKTLKRKLQASRR